MSKDLPIIGKTYRDTLTGYVGTCVAYIQWSTRVEGILDASTGGTVQRTILPGERLVRVSPRPKTEPQIRSEIPESAEKPIPAAVEAHPVEKEAFDLIPGIAEPTDTTAPTDTEEKPKRRRGRPRKNAATPAETPAEQKPSPEAEKAPAREQAPVKTEMPPAEESSAAGASPESEKAPPTTADLIAFAKDLVAAKGGNTKPLVDLLNEAFKVRSVAQLPEERRAEFIEAAQELYS